MLGSSVRGRAAMSAWYTRTHAHFVKDGMDFWWNDEGETAWYTYLRWNQAQKDQCHSDHRFVPLYPKRLCCDFAEYHLRILIRYRI